MKIRILPVIYNYLHNYEVDRIEVVALYKAFKSSSIIKAKLY